MVQLSGLRGHGQRKDRRKRVMLNLNADWFREHLLNFQGENYVIVSSDSYVVASQREELNAMSLSLLGRIGEQKRGYLIERLNGKRTICFFSPLDVNDWYCLRYVAYAGLPARSGQNPLLCVDCAHAHRVRAAFGAWRRAHPRV